MTPLYAELNRWRALPHAWGMSDCITLPADWILRMRGVDPAADIRMTYASLSECQRVTRFFTDPLGAVAPRLAWAGLDRTDQPVAGDFGLVLVPGDAMRMPHGALCLGQTWAIKLVSGAVTAFAPGKILAAWGVGYAHP